MFELHINVKISLSRIKVDIVHSDSKHKSLIECGLKIAWILFIMIGLIKADVLLVNSPQQGSSKYSYKCNDEENGGAASCKGLIFRLIIVSESNFLAENIAFPNGVFDYILD